MPLDKSLKQYRLGFVVVDVLAICAAFLLAHGLRHGNPLRVPTPYLVVLPYTVVLLLAAFRYFGAYELRTGGLRETLNILAGTAAGMTVLLALGFFYRGFSYSRLTAVYFGVFTVVFVTIGRHAYRLILDLLFGRSQWLKQVLVVGEGPAAERILAELRHHKSDYFPVGVVRTREGAPPINGVPLLGNLQEIDRLLDEYQPALVILASPEMDEDQQRRVIEAAVDRDIHWLQLPRVAGPPDQDLELTILAGLPLLGSKSNNITGFNYLLKRIFDLAFATVMLVIFSPLMLAVALLIKVISPGPVLFVQKRVGYRGRTFDFYKFRSMHVNNDESIHREYVRKWISGSRDAVQEDGGVKVHKLTRDPRVIPWIGPFIRKFSIDELPQLFNVLKGDMSLVGPRPCLPYEVELYQKWHRMRFDVLPGITGLWQVSGRNRLTFDEMVSLDVRYLQNWSLPLDLAIMLKTPLVVLFDKAY